MHPNDRTLADYIGDISVRKHSYYGTLWTVQHWDILGVGRTPLDAIADFNAAGYEPSGMTNAGRALLKDQNCAAVEDNHAT